MSMSDSYSKEEADQSFVKEADFTDNVIVALKKDKEVEKEICSIIKEYLKKQWIFFVVSISMSILAVSKVIDLILHFSTR